MKPIQKANLKTELYSFNFEGKEKFVRVFLGKKNDIILWEVEGDDGVEMKREIYEAFEKEFEKVF